MSRARQVLASPLFMEEALFTWAFRRWKWLLERLISDYTPIILGSWKSRNQNFELDCFWNQCFLAPKQRPDKFPFVADHIHATPTIEHTWTTSRHADIGGF